MNELPSVEAPAGEAPAVELAAALTSPKTRCACGTSWIGVETQPKLLSVPPAPLPVAAIFENVIEPKLVSGTVRQPPKELHSDGASAIHSAEVKSGDAIARCLVKT